MIGEWELSLKLQTQEILRLDKYVLENSYFYPWRTESKQGESRVGWNKRGNRTAKWNPGWWLRRNRRVGSCYRGCKGSVLGWSWVSDTEVSSGYFKESRRKNRRSHQVSHRESHGMVPKESMSPRTSLHPSFLHRKKEMYMVPRG